MYVSNLNDVIGPVMRGPSSSHTAGSFHIASVARSLLSDAPIHACFTFDHNGSYAKTFTQQGADRAFVMGLMGWPLTDECFFNSIALAKKQGLTAKFQVSNLEAADHPNYVSIDITDRSGKTLHLFAKSTGGGTFAITSINSFPIHITGRRHHLLIFCDSSASDNVIKHLNGNAEIISADNATLVLAAFNTKPQKKTLDLLSLQQGVNDVLTASPVYCIAQNNPIFDSAQQMVALAIEQNCSLGEISLRYEAHLLGISEDDVLAEMIRRFDIMRQSVERGLDDDTVNMKLLNPTASKILAMERKNALPMGGIHTKSAAMAMAAMHTSNSMGIVCAAPTGGSAGVLPGVLTALADEMNLDPKQTATALLAASAIGLIVAKRATFAAEVAGCQVEIGAAGAMAAAAVVQYAGGTPQQAVDAAAIAFQNTMGSVCDLVQGLCEIPCHTRNAVAASNAFICADLVLGGYHNPICLDETIDAVFQTGQMLPQELRCTSLGGIAQCPSALKIKKDSEAT